MLGDVVDNRNYAKVSAETEDRIS